MTEVSLCHSSKTVGGIAVEFPYGVNDKIQNEPCHGCLWRSVIDFTRNTIFEKYITEGTLITQLPVDEAKEYYAYLEARESVIKLATQGGIFSWENLQITRYPNLDNKIGCFVKNRDERIISI